MTGTQIRFSCRSRDGSLVGALVDALEAAAGVLIVASEAGSIHPEAMRTNFPSAVSCIVSLDDFDVAAAMHGPASIDDIAPLSPLQTGMLFESLRSPGSAYFSHLNLHYAEAIDPDRMSAALCAVAQRHAALRSVFLWDGVSEPLQIVLKNARFAMALSSLDTESVFADHAKAVDLAQGPLLFASLSTTCTSLALSLHHLLLDGWSPGIVLHEIHTVNSGAALPPRWTAIQCGSCGKPSTRQERSKVVLERRSL